MGIHTEAVQKLYVAYFNRPADAAGLTYWESVVTAANGNTSAVSAAFAASAEYKATFAGQNEYQIINTIYNNLFGRDAEVAGLTFWGQALINKTITIDLAVKTISEAAQGTDATAYKNKVAAATAFTAALDTTDEILNYSGDVANAAAKVFIAGVTTDASLAAAIAPAALAATVLAVTTPFVAPVTLNLTAGVDTAIGGAGNDIINATTALGANALTTFDNVDGGAGIDTIRFVDTGTAAAAQFVLPTGADVANVEVVSITTTGGADVITKNMVGVTDVQVAAAGTAAVALDVSNTTNVVVNSATTDTTTIAGGKAVTVSLADAAAGDVSVVGGALSNVTINGGAAVTVDNTGAAAATAKGTTLTSVSLNGITGATADLKGASLTNVSLTAVAQAAAVTVTNGTAAHTLNLTVDGVGYDALGAAVVVSVADAVATTVAVTAAGDDSNFALNAALATKVTVAGAGNVALDLNSATSVKVATVDASAATGSVTLTDLAAITRTVTTGAGDDSVAFAASTVKDDATTVGVDETKNATVSTGAGDDLITLTTTGTGKVTVDAGAGDDSVVITSRGTEILEINLGEGNDSLTATAAINGTDIINAGAGVDTLTLSLVGAANIGAFAGFDIFDTTGLNRTLDVDILASKNTVTEFIADGAVGAAFLTNVGAGVGVRVTDDMAGSTLTVTQKTAGAITVTVDADETGKSDDTIDTITASINATNATAIKAVFDTAYLANVASETKAGDNVTTLAATSATATSLEIVSGGTGSNNVLNYNDSANKLASATVTGTQALNLSVTTTKLATVDASAHTGGLTFSTASLADGGTVKIGSGVDVITVVAAGTAIESISGMEKAAAVAVSVVAADATAKATAIADADVLSFGAGVGVATDVTVAAGTIAKGVLTFSGTGPSTLTEAITFAGTAAETNGEAVVFQYLGDSYAFVQGATDIVVKLVGVTGVTNLVEVGATDTFFLV